MHPLVELRSDASNLRQARPRHVHQVVMLVVVADVERHFVERSVVRIGLLTGNEGEVLLNPAGTERMQANRTDRIGNFSGTERSTTLLNPDYIYHK